MSAIPQQDFKLVGTVSLGAIGDSATRVRGVAEGRLREVGVDARLVDDGHRSGPEILFFESLEASVCDVIRDRRGGDRTCVLAVAVGDAELAAGGAWKLLSAGAEDVFAYDESPQWVARVVARLARWRRVDELTRSREVRDRLVGESRPWRAALRSAVEVACFTDAPIVLTGETGTGKELVARLIHSLDPRPKKGELVLVDCTTIVPTLSGSEFFGHERGAFTGATSTRDGAFALADGGTLFLDEVGELPLALQAELLRVVQEGVYKRVGGNDWRKTSFRLVCATNRDLFVEADAKRFRHDLLYRLAGATLRLPSLRERREDILPLTRHFLGELRADREGELDDEVSTLLLARDYPGNVRELRQLVTRICYRHVGPGPLTVGDVPEDERVCDPNEVNANGDSFERGVRDAVMRGATLREITAAASELAIGVALAEETGSLQRAARRLGVTARALQLRRATGRLPSPATPKELPSGSQRG